MKHITVFAIFACTVLSYAAEPKTVITGGKMEMNQGGKVVVFSDKAAVTRGKNSLTADVITQDKASNRVEASGNIRLDSYTKEMEPIKATGEKAYYNLESGSGRLWGGRPHLMYYAKSSSGPVHMYADTVDFDQKKEEIRGTGSVEVLTSSACVFAPDALFLQREQKAVFTGTPQPKLVYKGEERQGTYTADRITMLLDKKKALLEGAVHGVMTLKDKTE